MFHFSSTLHFDWMLENELFSSTLFPMGMNDEIGFRTLGSNKLLSKTEAPLYIYIYIYMVTES